MENLIEQLFKINAVKFGDFTTKSGMKTPIYFDLRMIISFPDLMETLSNLMLKKMETTDADYKLICGVPYTALPIASIMSIKNKSPMVMRRKEAKSYGTKKLIEGAFSEGDKCLIVEDVVTSGSSILETVKDLREAGIKCENAVVLLNREQGGEAFLLENGIKMHSLLSMTELTTVLFNKKLISEETKCSVQKYIANNKIPPIIEATNRLKMSYEERIKFAQNNITKELLSIMIEKESNLCVAADLTDPTEILNLAEEVGPFICCLKTHIDIMEDFHPNFFKNLKKIAKQHNFIIMEDRKFADIGNTVSLQYRKGSFQINQWASLVTAHSIFGKSILDALKNDESGVFLVGEVSSSGSLIDEKYTNETVKLAVENKGSVTGLVCQNPLFKEHPGLLQLTPGVQIDGIGDDLGQRYNSPENVIGERGADIAVVGRGICLSKDRRKSAKLYRDLLWTAYQNRIK